MNTFTLRIDAGLANLSSNPLPYIANEIKFAACSLMRKPRSKPNLSTIFEFLADMDLSLSIPENITQENLKISAVYDKDGNRFSVYELRIEYDERDIAYGFNYLVDKFWASIK